MPPKTYSRLWIAIAVVLVSVATGAALMRGRDPGNSESGQSRPASDDGDGQAPGLRPVGPPERHGRGGGVDDGRGTPTRRDPNSQSLVITKLIKAGAPVEKGDLLVEFDRQTQLATALDRRAELNDLDQQIKKKDAGERAAKARDDGEILLAESSLSRAKLETTKNELLPRIQAEKNDLAVEQAIATLNQLKTTYALKRKAAEADVQILKIRRDRAENAMRQAETNAERMAVVAPISGMAVLRMVWKTNNHGGGPGRRRSPRRRAGRRRRQPEGDARARAGQPGGHQRSRGRPGRQDRPRRVSGAVVRRPDRADLAASAWSRRCRRRSRIFVVLIDVNGSHPNLMPDLTASLDVTLSRAARRARRPARRGRDDGKSAFVRVKNGSSVQGAARDRSARRARSTSW